MDDGRTCPRAVRALSGERLVGRPSAAHTVARRADPSSGQAFRVHSRSRPFSGTVGEVTSYGRGLLLAWPGAVSRRATQSRSPFPTAQKRPPCSTGWPCWVRPWCPSGTRPDPASSTTRCGSPAPGHSWYGTKPDRPFAFDGLAPDLPPLEHVVAIGDAPRRPRDRLRPVITAAMLDEPASVDPMQPAVIGWTSGTTGDPKGVMLSHRALCAETRAHMSPMMASRSRPLASTSPIAHVTGMLVSVLVPPLLGQEIHLLDYWDAGEVLELMTTELLSAGTGAPLFLASLLDHPACTARHHALIEMSSLGAPRCPPSWCCAPSGRASWRCAATGAPSTPASRSACPPTRSTKRANTDGRPCRRRRRANRRR